MTDLCDRLAMASHIGEIEKVKRQLDELIPEFQAYSDSFKKLPPDYVFEVSAESLAKAADNLLGITLQFQRLVVCFEESVANKSHQGLVQ